MPHQLLDILERDPLTRQLRPECMPEHVGADVRDRCLDRHGYGQLVQEVSDAPPVQTPRPSGR